MILTGERATQYFEQEYRKGIQDLIGMFNYPKSQVGIEGSEIERILRAIASRGDADSMRDVFRAFYSNRLSHGLTEGKTRSEIRQNALWRMDQVTAYADARNSGIPGYVLRVYSDPTVPLGKTQKFFRQAIGYNPTEPHRRLR